QRDGKAPRQRALGGRHSGTRVRREQQQDEQREDRAAGEQGQTTPAARSLCTFAFGILRRFVRISSVCCPRSGEGDWAAPGVSHRRTGTPMEVTAPALGCATFTNLPRSRR